MKKTKAKKKIKAKKNIKAKIKAKKSKPFSLDSLMQVIAGGFVDVENNKNPFEKMDGVMESLTGFKMSELLDPIKPKTAQEESDWIKSISPYEPVILSDEHCHMPKQGCFYNVHHYAAEHWMDIIIGWVIWDGMYLEMEAHAVCYNRNTNQYFDVTQRADGEKNITFLRDDSLSIEIDGSIMQTYRNIHFPSNVKKMYERKVTLSLYPNLPSKLVFKNKL